MRRSVWIRFVFFLLISSSVLLYIVYAEQKHDQLYVWFLDVGQGDAILIRTPTHEDILIDAGPRSDLASKVSAHLPFYDRDIELAILTHPQKDHGYGFMQMQKMYRFQKVFVNGEEANKKLFSDFFVAERGQVYTFGEIEFTLLNPGHLGAESNENGIVARMCYREICFLFTADIGFSTEEELLRNDIRSDVLKVGHHGSKYSTSKAFLEHVDPKYAIISAGKNNSYHHPHPSVLYRLRGREVLRTDMLGDIECRTNGIQVDCSGEK